jgi:hypothetical protein
MTMTNKKLMKNARQFAAFITDVAEAMKKHNVEDMLCVFGMNGEIRNTYIPLSENGEDELYCKLSDGLHEWLQLVGHPKSGNPKFAKTISLSSNKADNPTPQPSSSPTQIEP